MANHSNLISAKDLHSRIDEPDMRAVDCRFDLADPGAGRAAYRAGHIPGAVFADLDEDLAAAVSPESGRHPLPDIDTFAATLGRLGIGNKTEVVVYDAGNGVLAARAWWLLRWLGHERVRLLDGGYGLWVSSSRPVRTGEETLRIQRFLPRPCHDKVLTTAELASDLHAKAGIRLFDARDAARFRGEIEPIDAVAGHVPGAHNLPFQVSLNDDGTWKARADLEALWRNVLGEDRHSTWAVMCGSGVTACHLAISAIEAGFREPRLYVGSWSEWIRDPARPVGRGEGPDLHIRPADMA
jgi:thiosulfate/3-mercaptopyruvate sulfurtransferase